MCPSAAVSITPNWSACAIGARSAATVTAAPALDVLLDHLARVHAVDVVGAEHDDVVGPLVAEQVEVLVDRVGRAGEPVRPAAHLRRHRRDVVAEQRRQPPGQRDVAVERVALVLREHDDPAEAGVDEVRQREVDQPVVAAERHGRLGAVERQRHQALALAAGEHDREDVRHRHRPSSARCLTISLGLVEDPLEALLAVEALRVDLVDVLGPGRPRGEPAVLGDDLQAADRRAVAGRAR